uniref:Pecanex-like protein n=1 Tax=Ascaris lumbricoides TaxID=6252 RepID=A0A0M3I0Z1_ASCLU
MLPLKILSSIFSIHHCPLVILYFALLFHILLCAKKKSTKSETAPIKKNATVKRTKTLSVADKNARLGAYDPDLINRIPQVPPNDAEVDDKSLQSDDGASTNLLNLPLATAGGLASATATGGDKKIDKDKQNSVASTILLSISKQLIAHPSDMKVSFIEAKKLSIIVDDLNLLQSGDGQGGVFREEEQTHGEHAQKAEQAEPGQKVEHTDNVEKVGKVRKSEEGGEQVENNDQFEKREQAQKSKKLDEEEKNGKVKQVEKAEVKEMKAAAIEQCVVPLDRTQSQENENVDSTPESSTLQSNKIQLLSTQSASSQSAVTQTTDTESSKASTRSTPDSERSLNVVNNDANSDNRNISQQKILVQRKRQPSKRSKKSSKKQEDKRSIKQSEKLSKRSSNDSRSGRFLLEKSKKSTAVQNELQRGAMLHQADTKQWRQANPTPIEEVSLQSSPAPQEIEEAERGSVSKGREKMPQGTPQRRLANTQRQSGKEMQPLYPEKSKDSVDSASEAHSDAQLMNSFRNADDMQLHIQASPNSRSKHETTSLGSEALQSNVADGHTDIRLELPTRVEANQSKAPEEGKFPVSCYLQLR